MGFTGTAVFMDHKSELVDFTHGKAYTFNNGATIDDVGDKRFFGEKTDEKRLELLGFLVVENCNAASNTILDSGDRTEFESGAVRDIKEDRGRCDLLPLDVVCEMVNYTCQDKPRLTLKYLAKAVRENCPDALIDAIMEFCKERGWDTPTAALEVSYHFRDGSFKYGERNWEKGIPLHSYVDSTARHYLKWLRGDTDEPHDRAVLWNLMCARWTAKHKPEMNDLPKYKAVKEN